MNYDDMKKTIERQQKEIEELKNKIDWLERYRDKYKKKDTFPYNTNGDGFL